MSDIFIYPHRKLLRFLFINCKQNLDSNATQSIGYFASSQRKSFYCKLFQDQLVSLNCALSFWDLGQASFFNSSIHQLCSALHNISYKRVRLYTILDMINMSSNYPSYHLTCSTVSFLTRICHLHTSSSQNLADFLACDSLDWLAVDSDIIDFGTVR